MYGMGSRWKKMKRTFAAVPSDKSLNTKSPTKEFPLENSAPDEKKDRKITKNTLKKFRQYNAQRVPSI